MVHPMLAGLFAALDAAGVRWCLLRGADNLAAPEGDVDLLVAHGDRERAVGLARAQGFALMRRWAGGTQHFLLGRGEDGTWLVLHAVSRLGFGPMYPFTIDASPSCLGDRVRRGEVWTLAPPDEFWVTLLHALLDKGVVAERHRERLRTLVETSDARSLLAASPARAVEHLTARHPARLIADVEGARWDDLDALARRLHAGWRRRAGARGVALAVRNAASLWSRKSVEPVTKRGIALALLAPDGAGKTTVASRLASDYWFPTRTVYLGLYGAAFRTPRLPIPGGDSLARLARLWASYAVARYHMARRRLVVLDRHPIELRLRRNLRERVRRAILSRAVPAPDVVVVLDAPGEVLFARKGEHTPEVLEERRYEYLALAERLGSVVVDATRSIEEVVRAVAAAAWEAQLARERRGHRR